MFENHDFKPYYISNGGKCIQGANIFFSEMVAKLQVGS